MIGIVSSCATVTSHDFLLTLHIVTIVFTIFDFKKCRDLEIGVSGHLRSLEVMTGSSSRGSSSSSKTLLLDLCSLARVVRVADRFLR